MIDPTMAYIEAAAELAGIKRFYTRRVIQRLNRGEISTHEAAELLLTAAQADNRRRENSN